MACHDPLGTAPSPTWTSPSQRQLPTSVACERSSFARTSYPQNAESAWTAIVVFVSSANHLSRVAPSGHFMTWDQHLLGPREVPLIFYPKEEPAALRESLATSLNLTSCGVASMVDGCERWQTGRRNAVLTCATDVWVPRLYGGTMAKARLKHLNSFCGVAAATGEYVVSTKWFTYPMLLEPVLGRFDFWSKIDVDVCFRRRVDLTHELVRTSAFFWHTRLQQDNPNCERSLGAFMVKYTNEHPCCRTSEALAWQPDVELPHVPYSNMIAGWLGFWQSDSLLYFAKEWHAWTGGLVNRWTDQQFWMPALRASNVSEHRIVAATHLRYHTFEHTKVEHFCDVPRPSQHALQAQAAHEHPIAKVATPIDEKGEVHPSQTPADSALCSLANLTEALPRGSTALASYLRGVYGAGSSVSALASSWDWATVEVIWARHLPSELREACTWPTVPAGRGSVFSGWWSTRLLWVYQFATSCEGVPYFHGGGADGGYAREVTGRWVEVTHAFSDDPLERDALFLTLARGSGLWYFSGRTLLLNDAGRLDSYLNELGINSYNTRKTNGLLSWQLQELRRRGFASVIFNAHVDFDGGKDGRCTRPGFFKRELVSLRLPRVQHSCPPDPMHMAWGAPPMLHRPCVCVQHSGDQQLTHVRSAPVWKFVWPYVLVECDTSAVGVVSEVAAAVEGERAAGKHPLQHAAALEAPRQYEHVEHAAFDRATAYPVAEQNAWYPASLTAVAALNGTAGASDGASGAPLPHHIAAWT